MSDGYQMLGAYSAVDAKAILAAFEEGGIRFAVQADDADFRQMGIAQVISGGRSGLSLSLMISVHPDDLDAAAAIVSKAIGCRV